MDDTPGVEESPGQAPPAEPAPAAPPAPADRTRWAIIAFFVVIAVIAAATALPGLLSQRSGGSVHPVSTTLPATTIVPPTHRTPRLTPVVSPGVTSSVTSTVTAAPTYSGPPDFSVTIAPRQISAHQGDTVVYHMTIQGENGFSGQIHMVVTASFFIFSQTQDLGYQGPPYPKTIDYPFVVPNTIPPGATVNGVVTSTGDGITHEDHLTLTVQ